MLTGRLLFILFKITIIFLLFPLIVFPVNFFRSIQVQFIPSTCKFSQTPKCPFYKNFGNCAATLLKKIFIPEFFKITRRATQENFPESKNFCQIFLLIHFLAHLEVGPNGQRQKIAKTPETSRNIKKAP